MSDLPTTIVAGLGRCGLTMTIRMLDVGGLYVSGTRPAYEQDVYDIDWTAGAVKMVDPLGNGFDVYLPPAGECQWIWMARDAKQQARSMVKMIRTTTPMKPDPREIRKSIRPDTRTHFEYIEERRGEDILKLRFEDAIERTEHFAKRLQEFVTATPDVYRMMQVVRDRTHHCLNDMSMEINQTRDRHA